MGRRGKLIIGVVLALPALAVVGALVALPRIDLAPMVAARASAALGRGVTIESLRVTPGRVLGVVLRGMRLDNIEHGSAPAMMELARAEAQLDLFSLLGGAIAVRRLEVEGFALLLERTVDRRANWHFGPHPQSSVPASPPDRSALPMVQALRITGSEVVFRTTGGARLTTRLDTASVTAADAAAPAALRIEGSYNAVPVVLEGGLGSFAQLRDAATPFPMRLRATAQDTAMLFEGAATDPLNFDGLDGRLTLAASTPRAILEMAGGGQGAGRDVPVDLAGHFVRQGDLWRWRDAMGTLGGGDVGIRRLELTEGRAGQPDRIVAWADFDHLDVNRVLGPPGAQGPGDADIPLVVPSHPDPMLDITASARTLIYARLRATDARAILEVAPGRIMLHEAALTAFRARMTGSAELLPAPRGARVTAQVELRGRDIDELRSAFGLRALPVAGPISADIVASGEAASVNAATRDARISAVVGMSDGTIAREVIEMASTDVRALFRTSRGTTPIRCLLAAVDIDAGVGRASPLRIRAGTGTISGIANFDLSRQRLDLIIGSQGETTDFFALDVPVQVSGSFDNPQVAPATWSRAARERMARNEMAPLPPDLRAIAQRNPCYRGQGPGR